MTGFIDGAPLPARPGYTTEGGRAASLKETPYSHHRVRTPFSLQEEQVVPTWDKVRRDFPFIERGLCSHSVPIIAMSQRAENTSDVAARKQGQDPHLLGPQKGCVEELMEPAWIYS